MPQASPDPPGYWLNRSSTAAEASNRPNLPVLRPYPPGQAPLGTATRSTPGPRYRPAEKEIPSGLRVRRKHLGSDSCHRRPLCVITPMISSTFSACRRDERATLKCVCQLTLRGQFRTRHKHTIRKHLLKLQNQEVRDVFLVVEDVLRGIQPLSCDAHSCFHTASRCSESQSLHSARSLNGHTFNASKMGAARNRIPQIGNYESLK